jgi:triose/dihydroxyacetone kinase / FAD-AMP lyase (cyclizing)
LGDFTGDILHFGLAKEKYAATHPRRALKTRFVIIGDDVSVDKGQGSLVGRRCV